KRAYCLKTQPATGETYPKSDLFNKAQLISNKDFHAQSPSVKRLMKVEIIFASNSQVVLWKFA
ncbi:hypothetical protein JZL84_23605, partial [Escherichia coli]